MWLIDVWHCNSTGKYSGFQVENTVNESFLRGLQPTDRKGVMHMVTSFRAGTKAVRPISSEFPPLSCSSSCLSDPSSIAAHTNGTVDRQKKQYVGGSTKHVGQGTPASASPHPTISNTPPVFFPEELLALIDTQHPYVKNSAVTRFRNAQDFVYNVASKDYNGEVE